MCHAKGRNEPKFKFYENINFNRMTKILFIQVFRNIFEKN